MSAKKRSPVVDFLVYAIIRCVVCVLQALSFERACGFADWLAWLAYRVDKRHRLVARENLEKAFPGQYSSAEIDELVRGVYRHFSRVVIEIVFIPRKLNFANWRQSIALHGGPRVVDALLSGRPLLIVTGHFGNWEMGGYALGLFGFATHAIARPLDNPYLDDFMRRFRERTGQKILAKHGDFQHMQAVLENGGVLATLADQDAGPRGVFVDYFGRPASTHKAVALMAIEYNVPMVVVGTPFYDGKYHLLPMNLIDPADYGKTPDAIKALTQQFTSDLESIVRRYPEQYLWLHRRWKHQPAEKKKKKAA
jgi:KDO2-lipid IV(A) lauroyltransferase